MPNRIGVKDTEGNNVCVISFKNRLPTDFYDKYVFKNVSWVIGDGMAFMEVETKK